MKLIRNISSVLLILSTLLHVESVYVQKNCCNDDYLNFTGINCVSNNLNEYPPALSCDNYVLLAEAIDDEFDDGTACNVNVTIDGNFETLTVVCEYEPTPSFLLYLFPVSTIFLLLTICVYLKTGSYKLGQDVTVIIICLCLATVMIIRVGFLLNLDSNTFYQLDEYVGKFALIAYFAWLNVLMAHILVKLIHNSDNYLSSFTTHLYGWTIPTFVIYLGYVKAFGDFDLNDEAHEWYYKYLPITCLWCINLALFIFLTTTIIVINIKRSPSTQIQSGCMQFLRLILLASLWFTWLFEILSAKYPNLLPNFWYAMDITNALHGVIVFVVMVICRKSINAKLMGRSQKWSIFNDSIESLDKSNNYYVQNVNSVALHISTK